MAEDRPTSYTQGYSNCTTATHELRTAEVDAAFLLPYIKTTDHILDVGCGPGTITTALAKYASEGTTIGIDISTVVLNKAKILAAEANIPIEGSGSVTFEEGNILERLAYPDDTFDIVYSSQVFGHLPPPDMPVKALIEIRRILKPGGILATRDAAAQLFFPTRFELDRHWVHNLSRSIYKGPPPADSNGSQMSVFMRKAGFDADGGKVRIGASTKVSSGLENRKWMAWRVSGQLKVGDPFRQSWLDAGITVEEIDDTLSALNKWAETEDAWFLSVQCDMLAWK
jgi:ubiquinone/menaquinone biosynthesis C-methylase UbiE